MSVLWSRGSLEGLRVLAVVAHPDDEALGCGGVIAKLSSQGASVKALLPLHRSDPRGVQYWDDLLAAFRESCAILGADPILADPLFYERCAETHVHQLHDLIVAEIEGADVVLTHWPGDVNQVHRGLSRAVEIGTRPFRRRKDVYLFEVPSSTDQGFHRGFMPNAFVVLEEEHARQKCEAVALYAFEAAPGRLPDDVERKLRVRGSEVGCRYAEVLSVAHTFL